MPSSHNGFISVVFLAEIMLSLQGFMFLPVYWRGIFLPFGPIIICIWTCYMSYLLRFRFQLLWASSMIIWLPAITWAVVIFALAGIHNALPIMPDGATLLVILIFILIVPYAFIRFCILRFRVKALEKAR